MATVITVMNMKGGVGKTVISAHLAGMLARYDFKGKRRKVLAIDYDAQFNLSQTYISSTVYFALEKARKTSLAILQDDETDLNPYELQVPGNLNPPALKKLVHAIYPLDNGGLLDLIPSTLDLMYVALGQTSVRTDPFEERFRKFIDECRKTYDVVIIDCHPAGSILTRTALRNSDHVLIPVTPTPFAARGVSLMLQFVASGQGGARGAVPHILFNSEGKHPSDSQLDIRGNPRFAKYCLSETLRRRTAFSVPVGGENLVWFSRRPHSDKAFNNLCDLVREVVDRLDC